MFYPGYNTNAYDYQMLLIFLVVLFCTVIAAPVFSAEYQTQADDILRCTKYGKARLAVIKLLSALFITSAAFLCCAALYLVLSNSFYGWDMLKTSIQLIFSSVSLGSMNIGQLQLAVTAAGWASLQMCIRDRYGFISGKRKGEWKWNYAWSIYPGNLKIKKQWMM